MGDMVSVLVRERMSQEKARGLEAQMQFGEALKFQSRVLMGEW